jgi:GTP pyrophosphokinase
MEFRSIREVLGEDTLRWVETFNAAEVKKMIYTSCGEEKIEYVVTDPAQISAFYVALMDLTVAGLADNFIFDPGDTYDFYTKDGQVINKIKELYDADHPQVMTKEEVLEAIAENAAARANRPIHSKLRSGIVVKGITDLSVRFSKCCSPVPGDEIVGFVTRGRGISIHRTDCINIMNLPELDRVRLIDAEWQDPEDKSTGKYLADIKIYANDRTGLLADVSKALTEKNISIISMNTKTNRQGVATMQTSFEISGKEELEKIVEKIRNIEGVVDIERTTG